MFERIKNVKRYVLPILIILTIASMAGCINDQKSGNTSGNISGNNIINYGVANGLKDNNSNNSGIKFITVGDPHIKSGNSAPDGGNARLTQIIQFADKSDVDFVVFLGDIGNTGSAKDYNETKKILSNMTKPYYTIAGNHDLKYCMPLSDGTITDDCTYNQATMYERYFGPQTRLVNYKGYQLMFAGIKAYYKTKNGKYVEDRFDWIFNFDRPDLDVNKPTILFMHGVLKQSPDPCNDWGVGFTRYGDSMLPYLEKFNHLIATYSGHVHFDSEQTFDTGNSKGVKFITNDALVNAIGAGGGDCSIPAGDYVGYSTIKGDTLEYELVPYGDIVDNSNY